jgi:cytochrome b561
MHWLMAALILCQFVLGWIADGMARSPLKIDLMTAHKSLGISLLLLALVRLSWRWLHPAPPAPPGTPAGFHAAARISHGLLYLLMVILPLSGWIAASASIIPWKLWWLVPWPRVVDPDRSLFDQAAGAHEILAASLLALVALHSGAALWHHFIRRDGILLRMWRGD